MMMHLLLLEHSVVLQVLDAWMVKQVILVLLNDEYCKKENITVLIMLQIS
jgi:hypothetical protein